jgi:hypothetical protein
MNPQDYSGPTTYRPPAADRGGSGGPPSPATLIAAMTTWSPWPGSPSGSATSGPPEGEP